MAATITIDTLAQYWDKSELITATGYTPSQKKQYVAALEAAIADASEQVISYCTGRYDTSLWDTSTRPRSLQRPTAIITAHDLIASHGSVPERLKDAYDHAITYLRDIATGKVSLYAETGEARNSITTQIQQAQIGSDELYDEMEAM